MAVTIAQAHELYCRLTGQTVRLGYERERMWFELLRAGYTSADVHTVITYLQREIREHRRNVGALKLSNLLQVDRFEEDLQISRVRLRPAGPAHPNQRDLQSHLTPAEQEQGRRRALAALRQLKEKLH